MSSCLVVDLFKSATFQIQHTQQFRKCTRQRSGRSFDMAAKGAFNICYSLETLSGDQSSCLPNCTVALICKFFHVSTKFLLMLQCEQKCSNVIGCKVTTNSQLHLCSGLNLYHQHFSLNVT